MPNLSEYRKIVGDQKIDELLKMAKPFKGRYVVHVNSTYYGGGVAEILDSLVYIMNEAGINAGWRLLKGSEEFFKTTKLFHNGSQGKKVKLAGRIKKLYEDTNERNAHFMHLEHSDVIVAHDPQVLPLINHYQKKQPWIWRCHIDIENPDRKIWSYLKKFINKYDLMVVSDRKFIKKDIRIPQTIIMPSIDPLSEKNRLMKKSRAAKILGRIGIKLDKPLVSQIGRYDYWKDIPGVIRAFRIARRKVDCRLVLLGNYAADDPEGVAVYQETVKAAKKMKDVSVLVNVENNNEAVNALQTYSAVVLQKSIKEGFGLTVSEALWKGTPVIGGKAGGIPNQIKDGENGFLVESSQECAERIVTLLKDEQLRKKMGKKGREFVRENFLITRHLEDYLKLLNRVL